MEVLGIAEHNWKIAYEILSINSIDGIGESIAYGILCINSNDAIEESISLTKAS